MGRSAFSRLCLTALLGLCARTATAAATSTVTETATVSAEEMRAIEASIAADTSPKTALDSPAAQLLATAQTLLPNIALIGDFAFAAFSEDENLQGGGHDPTVNGFNLQQLELTMDSTVDPFFRFQATIVFAQFGVEVEEALATTLDLPFSLQARAGQFLTRFGRINSTHLHSWEFADQPF